MRRPAGRRVANVPLPVLLALRHLKSARRDSFSSFLSLVAVAGMTLGVAALLLSLAALSGFQFELKQEILARTPEIAVDLPGRDEALEVRDLAWRREGVVDVQVTRSGLGWLVSRGGIQAVELVGYDGDLPVHFRQSSDTGTGLYIPESLAKSWSLEAGDIVEVASSQPTLTPFGPQPRVRRLPLHGTFRSGKVEHRLRAAIPLADADALLSGDYRVLVSTGDLSRTDRIAGDLRAELPSAATVKTWKELNRALFFALRLEKAVMFLGVLLIILVAALALVSDLSLIIANKRREIGMLLAMGISHRTLLASFFLFGSGLATVAILGGATLGLGGAAMLERYRLLRLPQDVYFLDYVPFLSEPVEVGIVLGTAVAIAVTAATYAARSVLQLDPVEALRR